VKTHRKKERKKLRTIIIRAGGGITDLTLTHNLLLQYFMTNEEETEVSEEEEKRIKRKLSLEASVTLGLGYGAKKKENVKAFFIAVWPVLQGAGWTLVSEFVRL